jgi:hypothetical protein
LAAVEQVVLLVVMVVAEAELAACYTPLLNLFPLER